MRTLVRGGVPSDDVTAKDPEELGLSFRVTPRSALVKRVPLYLCHTEATDKRFDSLPWGRRRTLDGTELHLQALRSQRGWEWADSTRVYLFCCTTEGATVAVAVDGWQSSLVYVVQSLTAGRSIVSTLENRLGWRKRAAGETFHLKFAFQHLAHFFNYLPDASDPRQPKRHLCVRIFFPSIRMRREAAQLEIPGQTPLEAHMKADAQFHEETGVCPCGWLTIGATTPPVRLVSGVDRWSCDDLECGANVTHIRPLDNSHRLCATIPDLAIMSFDIEVVSSCFNADGSRKFPRAAEVADEIISYQLVLSRLNSGVLRKICLYNTRGRMVELPPPIEGVDVYYFESEKPMTDCFSDIIVCFNPVIIAGHNHIGFDWPYFCDRLLNKAIPVEDRSRSALFVSRFHAHLCEKREVISESKQKGKRVKGSPGYIGRLDLDTCAYAKDNYNLASYKLADVASKFLGGETKEDLTPTELFDAADSRDAQRIVPILTYGIQDAVLVDELLRSLKAVVAMFADAQVHSTLFDTLAFRGATAKAKNLLTREAHETGHVINDIPAYLNDVDEFEGAFVFDPVPGLYHYAYNDSFVVCFDFASLYPSIMQAYGICYSTYLFPGQEVPEECEVQEFEVAPGRVHRFVKCYAGIVPTAVGKLVAGRNDAKRRMREATTEEEKAVWDAVQKARKVGCNSLYGNFGANGTLNPETGEREGAGPLPFMPAAETITYLGRKAIERAAKLVVAWLAVFGILAEIIYGDTDSCFAKCQYSNVKSVKTTTTVGADGRVHVELKALSMEEKCKEIDRIMVAVAKEVSRIIGEGTKVPPRLEFEKSFGDTPAGGFLLVTKKRYAGMLREPGEYETFLKLQGLEAKRRDQPLTSRRMMTESFPPLLRGEPEAAADRIIELIRQIEMDELPIDDYVISKTMSRDWKAPSVQAGGYALPDNMEVVQVARKLAARNGEAAAPVLNDRVPYVHTWDPRERSVAAKTDCPRFVAESSGEVRIDRPKYLERASKAIGRIFLEQIFPESFGRITRAFAAATARCDQALRGVRSVLRQRRAEPADVAMGEGGADGADDAAAAEALGAAQGGAAAAGAPGQPGLRTRDQLFEGMEDCGDGARRKRPKRR